jgi:DNA-binding NtrC family response regulator
MEFRRVGGVEPRACDVRILAATHVDLAAAADAGTFRRDLFYRINVVPIHLPPLRERAGDIPLLVEHFIRRHGPKINPAVQDISRPAMRQLLRYPWPGNVRQLEHVVQRALILADGDTLLPEHLPIGEEAPPADAAEVRFNEQLPLDQVRDTLVEQLERAYLDKLLGLHQGSIRQTARHAGISERSVYEKLRKYNLDRRTYKGAPARRGGGRTRLGASSGAPA